MPGTELNREQIEHFLRTVGAKAAAEGKVVELYLFGGVSYMLGAGFRKTVSDIDFFTPEPANLKFLKMADDMRLQPDGDFSRSWLDHSFFLLKGLVKKRDAYFDRYNPHDPTTAVWCKGLQVYLLKDAPNLVLKMLRVNPSSQDFQDMYHLCRRLGITDLHGLRQVWNDNSAILRTVRAVSRARPAESLPEIWADIVACDQHEGLPPTALRPDAKSGGTPARRSALQTVRR